MWPWKVVKLYKISPGGPDVADDMESQAHTSLSSPQASVKEDNGVRRYMAENSFSASTGGGAKLPTMSKYQPPLLRLVGVVQFILTNKCEVTCERAATPADYVPFMWCRIRACCPSCVVARLLLVHPSRCHNAMFSLSS